MRSFAVLAVALLFCALAGCRRDPPGVSADHLPADPTAASAQALPPPAEKSTRHAIAEPQLPPPTLPEGSKISYSCDDGNEVEVTYTHLTALLRWTDGREVQLSRAPTASPRDGEVYVADKVSLQRQGGVMLQLHDGNAPVTQCNESSGTA